MQEVRAPQHNPSPSRPTATVLYATIAGLVLAALLVAAYTAWRWYADHFPRDLSPSRGRARLVETLDVLYHVPLDPSARILAAHAERLTIQDEGDDWYLIRFDPERAPRFEALLVARTRGSRMLLDHTHVQAVLNGKLRDLRPHSWDAGPPPGVRAWELDPHRDAHAVFFDDMCFLYDSRG